MKKRGQGSQQQLQETEISLYCAKIYGWYEVRAYHTDKETAKKLAIEKKKTLCFDEPIDSWTWERIESYFGADVERVYSGKVITEQGAKND